MGVTCQILINKPRGNTHKTGQAVTGIVKYVVDEPTEYKNVTLCFIGKGKCNWTERRRDKTRHYSGKEQYIDFRIDLHKKGEELITLHGEYQYPFEILLPDNIPPSFEDCTGSITYKIVLKFVKPSFFSFNKVFTSVVPVSSYVTPDSERPVMFGVDKKLTTLFSTKTSIVNLRAEINKYCFEPGENAQISYKVNNNSDVEIKSVKAELYCYKKYKADCGREKMVEEKIRSCEVTTMNIAERSFFEYSCILPTLPELYSIVNSNVINKEYRVKVTVRLPLPHINAIVEMPVLIAEQRRYVYSGFEVMEDVEPPPSYWEVMYEGEKEDEKDE